MRDLGCSLYGAFAKLIKVGVWMKRSVRHFQAFGKYGIDECIDYKLVCNFDDLVFFAAMCV